MKKIFVGFFLVLLFTGCTKESLKTETPKGANNTLSCSDMEKKVESGALLIDVREEEDYNEEHMDNAINIPISQIEEKIGDYAKKKSTTIILYCETGVRANQTAIKLTEMGYTNVYSLGGIRKCKKQ